jgi:hypothetical protein
MSVMELFENHYPPPLPPDYPSRAPVTITRVPKSVRHTLGEISGVALQHRKLPIPSKSSPIHLFTK